ncbi:MAG TPA: response regulator [Lacunisphaera sp.]|nr:response regulator [Lacunisphaera sp.]
MTPYHAPQPQLRVLHVEDNPIDAELTHGQIRDQWPDSAITRVDTRDDFITAVTHEDFDLILSDFTMPGFNGLEALDIARRQSVATPFMFLSGTIGEANAIEAMQHGAIDYVIKDRPARLIPAIKRALVHRNEQLRRRQVELQLREQAGWLDKARDAICVADSEGRITYWNHSAAVLFGWQDGSGPGHQLLELFGAQGTDALDAALQQVHATGAWRGDLRVTDRADHWRHVESRWNLLHDIEGRPKSILAINTDVTEQRRLESQLLRSQRLEGIGTLAGGIAHDLNNVLSPILMSVNLLQQELREPELLRLVEIMEKSTRHGAALIRQVLAFARGSDGERTDVQLTAIIKDVAGLLADTLPRAISVETELPRDLWGVRGDSTQLGQVFMNLGINARDALPHGGRLIFRAANVAVDAALARENPGAQPGAHVQVSVVDTGTGIPPEILERIFDPFFTTKAAGKGTGLGLSTVLGIVKGHGGFLCVRSEVGRGTEFRLYFPAVTRVASAHPGLPPAPRSRGRGETVLVIDDEDGVREIARALLVAYGYRTLVAANGVDGLALYRAHPGEIQAVLTDMMMPGLQGHDVIRELRAHNPDVRIVAMSGVPGELAAIPDHPGRLALLSKPMSGDELIAAVQNVLAGRAKPA